MVDLLQDISAELVLSSEGHVYLNESAHATEMIAVPIFKCLSPLFEKHCFLGLLHLGILEFHQPLPESFSFWQCFVRKFLTQACKLGQGEEDLPLIPAPTEWQEMLDMIFGLQGSEHASELLSLKYLVKK